MNRYKIDRKEKVLILQILATGETNEEQRAGLRSCLNLQEWERVLVDMETGQRFTDWTERGK